MNCKITNSKLDPFMSFGKMPLANGFITKDQFDNEFFFEMNVCFNENLSLLQLGNHPKPEKMFNIDYPFYTSSSRTMIKHFSEYANWIKKNFLHEDSKLIEIGSNDGTLLTNFKSTSVDFLGFEPSETIAKLANDNGIKTINSFFCKKEVDKIKKFKGNTDVICASNVICHIPNLPDTIETVDILLSNKGFFIFEEPYLGSMFDKTSYDQIYDEHIFIFSVNSVKKIFNLFDFDLIDVIPQNTHGGSMRYVVARKGKNEIKGSVKKYTEKENKLNYDNIKSCFEFKLNCEESKKKTLDQLNQFKKEKKIICGYAATSKSTTILNYCGINTTVIDFICDTTKQKIGKYSPGMHIPIVSASEFQSRSPDIAYLFAWNHKNEILKKETKFLERGGKWFSHVEI